MEDDIFGADMLLHPLQCAIAGIVNVDFVCNLRNRFDQVDLLRRHQQHIFVFCVSGVIQNEISNDVSWFF